MVTLTLLAGFALAGISVLILRGRYQWLTWIATVIVAAGIALAILRA